MCVCVCVDVRVPSETVPAEEGEEHVEEESERKAEDTTWKDTLAFNVF